MQRAFSSHYAYYTQRFCNISVSSITNRYMTYNSIINIPFAKQFNFEVLHSKSLAFLRMWVDRNFSIGKGRQLTQASTSQLAIIANLLTGRQPSSSHMISSNYKNIGLAFLKMLKSEKILTKNGSATSDASVSQYQHHILLCIVHRYSVIVKENCIH